MKKLLWLFATLILYASGFAQSEIDIRTIEAPVKAYAGTPIEITVELFAPLGLGINGNSELQVKFTNDEDFQNYRVKSISSVEEGNGKVFTFTAYVSTPKSTGDQFIQIKFLDSEVSQKAIELDNQVLLGNARLSVGYQGWFGTPNDGSINRWNHWGKNNNDLDNPTQDLWPLVEQSDYPDRENSGLKANDNSDLYFYSNAAQSTADTHVSWMKQYGLQSYFVGRFMEPVAKNNTFKEYRNTVMQNMINATNDPDIGGNDVRYAIFYNVTVGPNETDTELDYLDEMWNDWKDIVDNKDWVQQQKYLKKNGKPVLRIYGIGFANRASGITAAEARNTIRKFMDPTHPEYQDKYKAYIIGAVPPRWFVGGQEAFDSPEWADVYEMYDMIHPWMVGRAKNEAEFDTSVRNVITPDLARINELHAQGRDIGYLPLIFPGFSWFNLNGNYNVAPRMGGEFYWHQAYRLLETGLVNIMIANFDEVDEGTAIYKCVNRDSKLPKTSQFSTQKRFLHLNGEENEGLNLPPDWYLRITREIRKMVLNVSPLVADLPISPDDGGTQTQGDNIVDFTVQQQVFPGSVQTATVAYTASEDRDLVVALQLNLDPWTNYGNRRVRIPAGSGTVDVSVCLSNQIPIANDDYKWVAYTTPENGNYGNLLDEVIVPNIDVVPAAYFQGENRLSTSLSPESLVLHPNPANTSVSFEGIENLTEVTIYHISGAFQKQVTNFKSGTIDVSELPNGTYVLSSLNKQGERSAVMLVVEH